MEPVFMTFNIFANKEILYEYNKKPKGKEINKQGHQLASTMK